MYIRRGYSEHPTMETVQYRAKFPIRGPVDWEINVFGARVVLEWGGRVAGAGL